MTRGKNARAVVGRAQGTAADAVAARREAEIVANKLRGVIEERDREIAQLKDALSRVRGETRVLGTHTDADVARYAAEAEDRHRNAVAAGFQFLTAAGVRTIPRGKFAEVAAAFQVDTSVIMSGDDIDRFGRRLTTKKVKALGGSL